MCEQGKQIPGYTKLLDSRPNAEISKVLDEQRRDIEQQMKGYMFPAKLNVSSAKDLVLAEGGQPVRSLIVTSWRSGSTFMGDILRSHPGTYYHYEPLHDFGIKQVRSGGVAAQALHNLKHFLSCDYSEMEHFLRYAPSHKCVFDHNDPLWSRCKAHPDLCWKAEFLSPFCSLFPFQALKTVRLRLNLTQELLEDERLGVQLVLLVRDPRGTLHSRRKVKWCSRQKDCDDPETLCKDLFRDYVTASVFSKKFPQSFRAIRYEDFSFDVYNMTKELLDFFHLDFHPDIQKFLATHTNRTKGNSYSTFRDSRAAPVHWQKEMTWKRARQIQGVCDKALRLWGYELAEDEKHLRSFMPVGRLEFP
ncbi:carbohydrate sulfotransferase 5-like [Penaeus japonicus]|uniref:carbohydrate sulfotransferase 5-like n=1 Tax=Penaeus japonicus TaxID=27405 RepID=UPI001C711955|nr:carbohydrate sulfotransferase 5-like [Penaeus japonicus]